MAESLPKGANKMSRVTVAETPTARTRGRSVRTTRLMSNVLLYAVLLLIGVVMIFPFLWMVSASLMEPNEAIVIPPKFFPYLQFKPTFFEFQKLFSPLYLKIAPFDKFIFNSTYIALIVVVGRIFTCSLAGYGFARIPFKGSGIAFSILMSALLIPPVIRMIPLYFMYKSVPAFMGGPWLDTHFPLIVQPILANTFGTFLMRQFFMTLPKDLEEAARIDGSSTFGIFWKIAVPLSRPVFAALAIFTFQGSWNDFQTPVIYIFDVKKQTLPVGLSVFSDEFGSDYEIMMAGALISLLPILVVYSVAQRYFVQGIALSGIKG
jgi:multiple sugar transport system permease protein